MKSSLTYPLTNLVSICQCKKYILPNGRLAICLFLLSKTTSPFQTCEQFPIFEHFPIYINVIKIKIVFWGGGGRGRKKGNMKGEGGKGKEKLKESEEIKQKAKERICLNL